MSSSYLDLSLGSADAVAGRVVTLGPGESRHAVAVARVRAGKEIVITNGHGLLVTGLVIEADAGGVRVEVVTTRSVARRVPEVWLVQALATGGRDEAAIQAAFELGVTGVVPWQAERSVARWSAEKTLRALERWRTIARESSKQAVRAWLPEVREPIDSIEFAAEISGMVRDSALVLVLHPGAELSLASVLGRTGGTAQHRLATRSGRARESAADRHMGFAALSHSANQIFVLIGPEGGLTEAECQAFTHAGAHLVSLGTLVMRTSTAAAAALATLNTCLDAWR